MQYNKNNLFQSIYLAKWIMYVSRIACTHAGAFVGRERIYQSVKHVPLQRRSSSQFRVIEPFSSDFRGEKSALQLSVYSCQSSYVSSRTQSIS